MSDANFSAKDVQTLRQQTGAGMMDAKRALQENGGNMEDAGRWLREKGLAQSAKRSDRAADQGAVSVANTGSVAAAVELRCETDFVAKSPDFVALVEDLADAVATKGENAVAERQGDVESLGITLKENISVGRVVRFEAPPGAVLDAYLHIQNERGVNGVLVELQGGDQGLAHELALHIAFARPEYLTRDEVPAEEVDKERQILEAETRNEGKPEQAIPKIVEGKLAGRFFAERVLLEQKFVRDPKMTIKQLLGDAKVTRFAQVEVGR
jgi:elongation factor Ts